MAAEEAPAAAPSTCTQRLTRCGALLDGLVVWLSLLAYSAIAAPVPATNEPHYLTKARHFWQPDFCPGDFFLDSADAHAVFFATIGWLTTFCSLPVVAWIGRVLSLGLVAAGWTACAVRLVPHRRAAILSAWLFVFLTHCGNWSGEWLIGGMESKVFAYGLIFLGWAALWDGRWRTVAVCAGLAIALHPVVGGWAVLATLGALLLVTLRGDRPWPGWPVLVESILIVIALSMPGLLPVLRIVLAPIDAETRYAANYLQVFYRLSHHLDPMVFPLRAHLGYAVLIGLWLIGLRSGRSTPAWRLWQAIVAGSLLFALAGLAIGWGPRPIVPGTGETWRMALLKFYPFRLADLLIPISVCWSLTALCLQQTRWEQSRWQRGVWSTAGILFIAALVGASQQWPARWWRVDQPEDHIDFSLNADWIDVCHWMKANSPPDALVHTPHFSGTFKWFAERAEYVNYKDCPQDARGIVEWNRRLLFLTKMTQADFADGRFSLVELSRLREATGIDYIVTDRFGPMDLPAVYRNPTFQVYDLRQLDESPPAPKD